MFFLLLKSALCATNADLKPPFFPNELNQVGFWDFGGCAKIYEDKILFIPPTQFHQSSAWSNIKIPDADWSIQFSFGIDEGTGGGGFAIWIIDQLTTSGTIHGGPDIFKGISISADIMDDKIFLELIQSNRIRRFFDPGKPTNATIPIVDKNVTLLISFSKNGITIFYIDQNTKKYIEIINQPLFLQILDFYIGITAQNDELTSLIIIYTITFFCDKLSKQIFFENRSLPHFATPEHYTPSFSQKLRNPAFFNMRTEISQYEKTRGKFSDSTEETTAAYVLDSIQEISAVCYEAASFSELNNFIRNTIIPYTNQWQRRTHKIVKYAHDTKVMFHQMCEESKNLADSFSQYTNKSIQKADKSVSSLKKQFVESLKTDMQFDEIVQNYTNRRILNLLFYISLFEVFLFSCFALYFLLQKHYL